MRCRACVIPKAESGVRERLAGKRLNRSRERY